MFHPWFSHGIRREPPVRVPQVLQRAAPREAPTADPGAAEECALWARQQRGPQRLDDGIFFVKSSLTSYG